MESSFRLEIITPERTFFSGDVQALIVPAPDGQMEILKGHEPIVVAIYVGIVKILTNGEWKECTTSDAFMEVRPDKTLLYSQAMEWPEEIDIDRALAAKERAEQRLRDKKSYTDYVQSKIALQRAMVRLKSGRKNPNLD
jgi:F-type H+-transporting ATPase subunit epsilon